MLQSASRRLCLFLAAGFLLGGCSAAGGNQAALSKPDYPGGFLAFIAQQPDLEDALARIDGDECDRALPLLTLYSGQDERSEVVDYLLGRAYLCLGEFLKSAHHLKKAWVHGPDLRPLVRAAARDGARAVVAAHKKRDGLSFGELKACYQFHAFGTHEWYSPEASLALRDYGNKLAASGSDSRIAGVVKVMERIGAPATETFPLAAGALIRLGELAELKSLVAAQIDEFPVPHEILAQTAQVAEAAFRHEAAAWLYAQSIERGSQDTQRHLHLATAYLKSQNWEPARLAWQQYLKSGESDEVSARLLTVASLLQRYDRHDEAIALLEEGKEAHPKDFTFYRELAALGFKVKEKIDPEVVFGEYLAHREFCLEALSSVGEQCVKWKQWEAGQAIFEKARQRKTFEDEVLFFLGAFKWQGNERKQAQRLFDRAVKTAGEQAVMLDRVALFLVNSGDPGGAGKYLEEAVRKAPDDAHVLVRLAALREKEKKGEGYKLLKRKMKGRKLLAGYLVIVANWCVDNGYPLWALELAEKAVAVADASQRAQASMLHGRLLLRAGRAEDAIRAFAHTLEAADDKGAQAAAIFSLAGEKPAEAFSCFVYETASALRREEKLPQDLFKGAAAASIRCGKTDRSLVVGFVRGSPQAADAFKYLLSVALDSESRAALVSVEEELGSRTDDPELAAQFARLFAASSRPDRALEYAQRYLARTTDSPVDMAGTARKLLLHGAEDAAREILVVAWERADEKDRAAFGLLLATLYLTRGEDDKGLAVVRELSGHSGRGVEFSVAAASILIDAGKAALAEEICRAALAMPDEGTHPRPTFKLEGTKGSDDHDKPFSKAELMMLLAAQEPEQDLEENRRTLVALLAWSWKMQGKEWRGLVEDAVGLVKTWHGEHLVAQMLQRLGAREVAVELYKTAFDKSPADFDLAKGYVTSLVYQAHQTGDNGEKNEAEVSRAASRFVKARESDPEAFRQMAAFLEGKGLFAISAGLLEGLAKTTTVDAPLALALARTLASQGRPEDAAGYFRMTTQLGACSGKTVSPVLEELKRVGAGALALELMQECSSKYPKDAFLHLQYARLLLDKGTAESVQEAAGRMKKAVLLDNVYLAEAGEMFHARSFDSEAMTFVELMVRSKNPEVVRAGVELAFKIGARTGDVESMTRIASQATRLNKGNHQLASEIAGFFFKYNLMDQGLERLKAAVDSDDGFVSLLLGIRLISMGHKETGLKRFNAFIEKTMAANKSGDKVMPSEHYRTLVIQLDFLRDLGMDQEGRGILTRLQELYPEDNRIRLRLMRSFLQADERKELLDQLELLVKFRVGPQERLGLQNLLHSVRAAGWLDQFAKRAESACSGGHDVCRPLLLKLYAVLGNKRRLAALVADMLAVPDADPFALLSAGSELLSHGHMQLAEELLNESIARGWGARALLLQAHRALAHLYSATGRRELMPELTRIVLLQTASDPELRRQLPQNLLEYEYLDEAYQQLALLDLIDEQMPHPQLVTFELLLNTGKPTEALELALSTSYQGENLLNGLITFASLARKKLAFEVARDLYRRAYQLDPTNQPLLFATAELALVLGETEEATRLYQVYRTGGGVRAALSTEVVQNMCKYNQLGMARRLARDEKAGEAILIAGLNFLRAGKMDDGSQLLSEALAQAGDKSKTYARQILGFGAPRPELIPGPVRQEAMKLACKDESVPAICRLWKGFERLEAGDDAGAMKTFDELLAGSDKTWNLTLAAFRALLGAGRAAKADGLLNRTMVGFNRNQVLSEATKSVVGLLEAGALAGQARDDAVTLARGYVRQMLAEDPYDFWYRTQLAEVELLAGRPESATKLYEKYIADTPWEPGLSNNLAYLLSKEGKQLERGLELVRFALAREPSHSAFYLDTEGWLLFGKGELDAAEKKIRAAIHRSHLGYGASLAESLYHLGVVQSKKGDREGATRTFNVASFLDPHGQYGAKARDALVGFDVDPYHVK